MKVPLAVDFGNNPGASVSATGGNFDRWPLQMLTAGATTDPREVLVLWIRTAAADGAATDPETEGPLELAIYGDLGGTLYQTVLAPVGLQNPASRGGHYLAILPVKPGIGFSGDSFKRAVITIKADDAWRPQQIELFALSRPGVGQTGRHLGGFASTGGFISQDPTDVFPPNSKPNMTVSFPLAIGP